MMAPLDRQQRSISPSASVSQSKTVSPPPSPLHHASDLTCVVLDSYPSLPPPTAITSSSSMYDNNNDTTSPLLLKQQQQKQQQYESPLAAAPLRILCAISALLGIPICLYKTFPADTVIGNLVVMMDTWDAFLHFSCVYLGLLSLLVGVYFGPCALDRCQCAYDHHHHQTGTTTTTTTTTTTNSEAAAVGADGCGAGLDSHNCVVRVSRCTGVKLNTTKTFLRQLRAWLSTVDGIAFATAMVTFVPMSLVGSFPMVIPSWCWYPMGWGTFRVYQSSELSPALQGICLDQSFDDIQLPRRSWIPSSLLGWQLPQLSSSSTTDIDNSNKNLPLCLSESSWDTLSGGALSSYNIDDVKTILRGVDYARTQSGGLAIAVLARDIKDSLDAFRNNVEALKDFFPNLTVVLFENDSTDGSREAIKEWATQAHGYNVDLMECAEAIDCKLGKKHRDSGVGSWAKSKAVGDMDVYRQRVTDYIIENPLYKDYSHMLVLDIDLAVSISPFGLIHSIGEHPENAIASSGRQLFPFSQGTLAPPYDMSAFQPWSTPENHWVLSLHESWCQMKPQGDRWRNACDPTSSFLMMELLRHDRGHVDTTGFYRVESAFNGAVVYPLKEIRDSEATYDAGEDGQRCEHIGFNLALNNPMYVNRKWDFHIDPSNIGGPSGWRAQNVISYVMTTPKIVVPLVLMQAGMFIILCHSFVTLGIFLVYPLLSPLLTGSKTIQRMISSHHHSNQKRRRIQNGASKEEALFKLV